jgi:hypothetical protein
MVSRVQDAARKPETYDSLPIAKVDDVVVSLKVNQRGS